MRAIDPIFVVPRLASRKWGRTDLGNWCKNLPASKEPIGEAWLHDAANATDAGPLGRRLASSSEGMLGDLGRAPPRLRLVFPGETARIPSTTPVSLWTILEPGVASRTVTGEAVHKTGERLRAYEGAPVALAAGCVALEVSAAFQPRNRAERDASIIRLPPVSRRMRATLFRDEPLSVEMWTLPEWSRLQPDGETCHVIAPLTAGATLDGRTLHPGEAVFIPAFGRPLDLSGAGARLLVAYPDRAPTDVWRHAPGPDPAAGQLPRPEPIYPPAAAVAEREQIPIAA